LADDSGCTDIACCCDASSVANGSDAVEFGDHRLDPVQLTVRAAAFRLLVDSGQPVDIASIAKAAGVERAKATEVLDGFARTGNVSLKGDRVVGIAGLSIEPPSTASSWQSDSDGPGAPSTRSGSSAPWATA